MGEPSEPLGALWVTPPLHFTDIVAGAAHLLLRRVLLARSLVLVGACSSHCCGCRCPLLLVRPLGCTTRRVTLCPSHCRGCARQGVGFRVASLLLLRPLLQVRAALSGALLLLVQQAFDIGETVVIEEQSGWRFSGDVQVGACAGEAAL